MPRDAIFRKTICLYCHHKNNSRGFLVQPESYEKRYVPLLSLCSPTLVVLQRRNQDAQTMTYYSYYLASYGTRDTLAYSYYRGKYGNRTDCESYILLQKPILFLIPDVSVSLPRHKKQTAYLIIADSVLSKVKTQVPACLGRRIQNQSY